MSDYIDNSDFFKDLEKKQEIMRKKTCSYRGLIPSHDFDSDFYQQYLKYATFNELDNDVITEETIKKIALINYYEDECEPKVEMK